MMLSRLTAASALYAKSEADLWGFIVATVITHLSTNEAAGHRREVPVIAS